MFDHLRVRFAWVLLAIFLGFGAVVLAGQDEKQEREQFSATIMGTMGPTAGRMIPIDIYVEGTTTDEQVMEYAELLMEGGQQPLRRALEKVKIGRIAPRGRIGNDIAIVRIVKTDKGTSYRMVTARVMPFLELYYGGRSTDHPFGVMEFTVDEEGKGEGVIIGAARLKFDEDGVLQITSYGHGALKLVNIRKYD
ncbi:MAG: hypothetical protein JSU96_16690 [Acidobacteriota bacterium]|nr:MAG: hypothetical protein JSU96_16690 [Acidobacteriota bacterium]